MEAVVSVLNLFETSMMQSAIVGESVQEFQPVAPITQFAPIEFEIEGGGRIYIDLNNKQLEEQLKLVHRMANQMAEG